MEELSCVIKLFLDTSLPIESHLSYCYTLKTLEHSTLNLLHLLKHQVHLAVNMSQQEISVQQQQLQ